MRKFYLLTVLLYFVNVLQSQTLTELFSIEGLKINSFHSEYTTSFESSSLHYYGNIILNNQKVLRFRSNIGDYYANILIEGKKVYRIYNYSNSKMLLYDFGLNIGDSIYTYAPFLVTGLGTIVLNNGEVRNKIDLVNTQTKFKTSWVEGIGDIKQGLFPYSSPHAFSRLVCVKSKDEIIFLEEKFEDICEILDCIEPLPDFDLKASGSLISIINRSAYGTNYLWEFGDGTFSTESSPTHTYDKPGCYSVKLILSNDCLPEGKDYSKSISLCEDSFWEEDFRIDTLKFDLYRFNDTLQFAYRFSNLYKIEGRDKKISKLDPTPQFEERRSINTLKMWDEKRGLAGCSLNNTNALSESVLTTNDGGLTWDSKIPFSGHIDQITLGKNGKAWVGGSFFSKSLYLTNDFGDSWKIVSFDRFLDIYSIFNYNDTILYMSFDSRSPLFPMQFAKSSDGGHSWDINEDVLPFYSINFVHDSLFYAVGNDYNMYESKDGGFIWNKVENISHVKKIYFMTENIGWVIDRNNNIYYTESKLSNYQSINCGRLDLIDFEPINDHSAFALSYNTSGQGKVKYNFDISTIENCYYSSDKDNDGYNENYDCDDNNPLIFPSAIEIPNNNIDEDCSGDDLIYKTTIYPNPTKSKIKIQQPNLNNNFTIYNNLGQIYGKYINTTEVDVSSFPSGIYHIIIDYYTIHYQFKGKFTVIN